MGNAVDPPRLNIVCGFPEVVESTEVMSVDSPMLTHRYFKSTAQRHPRVHKKLSHVRLPRHSTAIPNFSPRQEKIHLACSLMKSSDDFFSLKREINDSNFGSKVIQSSPAPKF